MLSLEDAEKAMVCDSKWTKGYYRKAEALWYLKRYQEGLEFVETWYKLDPTLFEEIRNRFKKQMEIENGLEKMGGIEVIYLSSIKGKGVIANQKVKKNQVIFEESPFVAIQKTDNMVGRRTIFFV